MKILHCADLHVRDKEIDEARPCLQFVTNYITLHVPDLIIIAGDLFSLESTNKLDSPAARLVFETISQWVDLAPVVIIIGTRSHDGLAPTLLSHIKGNFKIIVADKPTQCNLDVAAQLPDYNGVVLTLIPQPTKQFSQTDSGILTSNNEISQTMNAIFAGYGAQAAEQDDVIHILVGHWNVTGAKLPTGKSLTGHDIEISVDQMMLANPDLICLGHIHDPQQFGDRTFYAGSLWPQNWGERNQHGFWIHELDGKKLVKSDYIETPYQKMARFKFNLTDEFAEHLSLNDRLLKENYKEAVNGASVRIDIAAWQDKAIEIDKQAIEEYCLSAGAISVDIRITRVPRTSIRAESVLKATSLRDKVIRLAELREEKITESILNKADELEAIQ